MLKIEDLQAELGDKEILKRNWSCRGTKWQRCDGVTLYL